jgi:hypothetical protein
MVFFVSGALFCSPKTPEQCLSTQKASCSLVVIAGMIMYAKSTAGLSKVGGEANALDKKNLYLKKTSDIILLDDDDDDDDDRELIMMENNAHQTTTRMSSRSNGNLSADDTDGPFVRKSVDRNRSFH